MQITFELVKYDENKNRFEQDENSYQLTLSDEEVETYELLKDSDMNLYNWLSESETFLSYMKENICEEGGCNTFAISDINGTSFIRFYFFKVTSGDSHYEYFKKLFNILEESDWQDREEIGHEILEHLSVKQKELILQLS